MVYQLHKVDPTILRRLWSRITWRPTWAGAALLLILGLGAFFRVYNLGGRDLWTDEAWVALAALQDTPRAALAAGLSTPPLYMLSIWALAHLVGGSEAVLRSPSLFFGLGTLFLFWPLSRRLTSQLASLLGLAVVAFSPMMVYYCKELKQYSGDAFGAVLIFFLLERVRDRGGNRAWASLALAGVLGLGFSHTLVFILPVALAVLWRSPDRARLRVMVLGGMWAAAFAAYFLLFFRGQVGKDLVAYWVQDFPDFSSFGAFLWWFGEALYRYFWFFFGEWGIYWGLPLAVLGLILTRQGAGRLRLYVLGPILLTFAAAALHRYPFMAHYGGNRLMLFTGPLLYLAAAAGLAAIIAWLWARRQRLPAVALSALLLWTVQPVGVVKEDLYSTNNREEIQPLVEYLQKQLQPRDWVYVYYFAVPPFKYYFPGAEKRVCWGKSCEEQGLAVPASGRRPPKRLWLIAAHINSVQEIREFAAKLLGSQWLETACLTRPGAVLFCFDRQGTQMAKNRASLVRSAGSSLAVPTGDRAYK